VAGLLKRVVGTRIEQRRRALRAVLKTLAQEGSADAELLSADPAFTPTGRDSDAAGETNSAVTGTGGSVVGTRLAASEPSEVGPPAPASMNRRRAARMGWVSAVGYGIGVAGLAIALIVLLFFRR
jgi:hypothetical protein